MTQLVLPDRPTIQEVKDVSRINKVSPEQALIDLNAQYKRAKKRILKSHLSKAVSMEDLISVINILVDDL